MNAGKALVMLAVLPAAILSCDMLESDANETTTAVLPTPTAIASPIPLSGGFVAGDGVLELYEPTGIASGDPVAASGIVEGPERTWSATFDVSESALVTEGSFNELRIRYGSPDGCEREVDVKNTLTGDWDRITFRSPMMVCSMMPTNQIASIWSYGGTASDYVSEAGEVSVRIVGGYPISAWVSRFNPDFEPIRVLTDASNREMVRPLDRLAFDGAAFWIVAESGNTLYRVSPHGYVLESVAAPQERVSDLTVGEQAVWFTGRTYSAGDVVSRGYRMSLGGAITDEFSLPRSPSAITYADSSLWFAVDSDSPGALQLLRIDPQRTLADGVATAVDSFDVFVSPVDNWMLTTDGMHLLLALRNQLTLRTDIYRIGFDGVIVDVLENVPYYDIEWAEGRLWTVQGTGRWTGQFSDIVGRTLPPVNEVTE